MLGAETVTVSLLMTMKCLEENMDEKKNRDIYWKWERRGKKANRKVLEVPFQCFNVEYSFQIIYFIGFCWYSWVFLGFLSAQCAFTTHFLFISIFTFWKYSSFAHFSKSSASCKEVWCIFFFFSSSSIHHKSNS